MVIRTYFILFIIAPVLFVNCKREALQVQPKITHLSDFESNDGSVSLHISGGKAPYIVEWSEGSTDSTISNLGAGTYYLTITDAKKNTLTDTIILQQPEWPVCIDGQGNSYKTTIVGEQIWMIENLRATTNPSGDEIVSYVYDNNPEYAQNYGMLYTWQVAMNDSAELKSQGLCPDGWHIPSDEEWSYLIDNISTVDKEIPNLKKTLELQYAGFYNNSFHNLDASVSFWTSTESHDNAWKLYFNKSLSKAFRYHEKKSNAISVRCVKDRAAI